MVCSLGLGDKNRSEVVSHLDGNGEVVLAMAKWVHDTTRVLGSLAILYFFQRSKKATIAVSKALALYPRERLLVPRFA
jgi:hypothetical protein